jgi:hypothetical protein
VYATLPEAHLHRWAPVLQNTSQLDQILLQYQPAGSSNLTLLGVSQLRKGVPAGGSNPGCENFLESNSHPIQSDQQYHDRSVLLSLSEFKNQL